jgi:hypothetical protein
MGAICKNVKYAYQESPHSENTASPRSEKEEREREHVYVRILISKGHHRQLTKKRTRLTFNLLVAKMTDQTMKC